MTSFFVAITSGLLLLAGTALAEDRPLDVTIRVLESPNDTPDEVTRTIKLPPASRQSTDGSAPGRSANGPDNRDAGNSARANPVRGIGSTITKEVQNLGDRLLGKDKNKNKGGP